MCFFYIMVAMRVCASVFSEEVCRSWGKGKSEFAGGIQLPGGGERLSRNLWPDRALRGWLCEGDGVCGTKHWRSRYVHVQWGSDFCLRIPVGGCDGSYAKV